ncbi:ankyrin repeat domain-containing protein [Gimesia fumaroli]|uniref:Ankyrin repeats (3 copies) n=1 Tax=Gimesia fumaroli TaxID=2527976 RepID=A0A518IJR9_9PLAN|nr:ankyrin repeat domain-containing protein [Gimesia fumaroli]QDV53338.1 Ankyrin repeats (3 copies) [Gimesia fumaroli]
MAKKKSAPRKKQTSKKKRPQAINPFTGEPMDAVDWGDVFELVEKNKTRALKNLFEDGMTFEEFQNTYWGRLEDNEYLHRAAEQGSLPMVKLLIEQGADPDELDEIYQTPLERAFLAKKKQVAKYLFERTQSETAKQLVEDTLYPSRKPGRKLPKIDPELKQAIEEKSLKTVRALIKKGVPVNAKFKTEYKSDSTPLELAVDLNALKIAEALLSAGANPNPILKEAHPLATALFRKSPKMMSLLLEHGADPNRPGDLKKTCLMDAVDREEMQFINLLLEAGTDLNLRDSQGRQAIHFRGFLKSHRYDSQKEKKKLLHSANVTMRLIEAGADLQAETESGSTKLMDLYCEPRWGDTHQRYLDFKAALVEAGGLDPSIDDLLRLVRQNQITQVRKLIKEGVNVNHRGDLLPFAGQVTPLAMAVICGHHKLAELLIKSGANPDAISTSFRFGVEDPNAEEPRPYNLMEEDPHYFGHGLTWVRPVGVAVWKNDPEMIQILAEANASLMLDAGQGGAPLVWAIDLAHLESVQALLNAGANPYKSKSSGADAVFYANLDHTHPKIKQLVNQAAKKLK